MGANAPFCSVPMLLSTLLKSKLLAAFWAAVTSALELPYEMFALEMTCQRRNMRDRSHLHEPRVCINSVRLMPPATQHRVELRPTDFMVSRKSCSAPV